MEEEYPPRAFVQSIQCFAIVHERYIGAERGPFRHTRSLKISIVDLVVMVIMFRLYLSSVNPDLKKKKYKKLSATKQPRVTC